jgi:hypothetical protein
MNLKIIPVRERRVGPDLEFSRNQVWIPTDPTTSTRGKIYS